MGLIKKETSFLNKLFDNLNTMFFKDTMPQVVITIQGERAGAKDSYGWFAPDRWGEGNHEINITSEHFVREPFGIVVTMFHEMIHLYCHVNGIKDTSRQGRYHNKKFEKACEDHGLLTVPDDKIGARTPHEYDQQAQDIKDFYDDMKKQDGWDKVVSDLFKISREKAGVKVKKERQEKWLTCSCQNCNEEFKVKKETIVDGGEIFCPYCGHMHTINLGIEEAQNEEEEQ